MDIKPALDALQDYWTLIAGSVGIMWFVGRYALGMYIVKKVTEQQSPLYDGMAKLRAKADVIEDKADAAMAQHAETNKQLTTLNGSVRSNRADIRQLEIDAAVARGRQEATEGYIQAGLGKLIEESKR